VKDIAEMLTESCGVAADGLKTVLLLAGGSQVDASLSALCQMQTKVPGGHHDSDLLISIQGGPPGGRCSVKGSMMKKN
jgi:hypothetical protein